MTSSLYFSKRQLHLKTTKKYMLPQVIKQTFLYKAALNITGDSLKSIWAFHRLLFK